VPIAGVLAPVGAASLTAIVGVADAEATKMPSMAQAPLRIVVVAEMRE